MTSWRDVLEQLVRERGRALVAYAYVLTGNRDEADDLFQDALVRAFRGGRSATSLNAAHVYVKKAIATSFIDRGRREAVRPQRSGLPLADMGSSAVLAVEDHATAAMEAADLHAAVLTLAPRERACVVLRYMEDLSVNEIAEALGVAPGTVKRYLHVAIQRLRTRLPDLEFGEFDTADVTDRPGGVR